MEGLSIGHFVHIAECGMTLSCGMFTFWVPPGGAPLCARNGGPAGLPLNEISGIASDVPKSNSRETGRFPAKKRYYDSIAIQNWRFRENAVVRL